MMLLTGLRWKQNGHTHTLALKSTWLQTYTVYYVYMSKLQHRNSEGLQTLQYSVVTTVCDTEDFILEGPKFYIHYAFLENF